MKFAIHNESNFWRIIRTPEDASSQVLIFSCKSCSDPCSRANPTTLFTHYCQYNLKESAILYMDGLCYYRVSHLNFKLRQHSNFSCSSHTYTYRPTDIVPKLQLPKFKLWQCSSATLGIVVSLFQVAAAPSNA